MDFKSSLLMVLACASLAIGTDDVKITTVPSSSTTLAPETTTPPPSPPSTPPTTSTAAPNTTVAPTTTPAPAPPSTTVPPPVNGTWTVSVGNVTCIIAKMMVATKITYPLQAPNMTLTKEVSVPLEAKASGTCGADKQSVTLSWGESNNVSIDFEKNDTAKSYYVSKIIVNVFADEKTFPNISTDWVNSTLKLESSSMEFKTNVGQSYRCTREESLPLSFNASKKTDAVLVLQKVQLQAFHKDLPPVFGEAQDCELDTPDIVPIAVGCALAALVFIVLIAYLVGRRRSQARGYLSIFLE